MAATNPGDGSRAHRPDLESRRTTFVSRPSSQGLEPVSRLRGTAPNFGSARYLGRRYRRLRHRFAATGRPKIHSGPAASVFVDSHPIHTDNAWRSQG